MPTFVRSRTTRRVAAIGIDLVPSSLAILVGARACAAESGNANDKLQSTGVHIKSSTRRDAFRRQPHRLKHPPHFSTSQRNTASTRAGLKAEATRLARGFFFNATGTISINRCACAVLGSTAFRLTLRDHRSGVFALGENRAGVLRPGHHLGRSRRSGDSRPGAAGNPGETLFDGSVERSQIFAHDSVQRGALRPPPFRRHTTSRRRPVQTVSTPRASSTMCARGRGAHCSRKSSRVWRERWQNGGSPAATATRTFLSWRAGSQFNRLSWERGQRRLTEGPFLLGAFESRSGGQS